MKTSSSILRTDVAVFGAGPAGIAAAVTAAREGHTVCLVEVQNTIGGVMASCPGMMLGGGYPLGRSIGGFFEEFVDRMVSAGAAERRACSLENFGDEVVYDHEYAIATLYDLLAEAGVRLLLNHIADEVVVSDDRIDEVVLVQPQGHTDIHADVYIDCSGNGDLATKAGVPCEKGDQDGKLMGASLTFFLENVDWGTAFADTSDPYFTKWAERGIASGRIHESIPQVYMLKGFHPGSVFFNTVTVTGVDGTQLDSVVAGTALARQRVRQLASYFRDEVPGFEKSRLAHVGPTVGVRETRRLEGRYRLKYEDIAAGTRFADGIVACDNPLDEVFRDESVTEYSHDAAVAEGNYYTIPFRCLVPRRVRNLLFAGRAASVDAKAFASIRGMPQCMAMGQAAGVGASAAIAGGLPVQEIDGESVRDVLIRTGVAGLGADALDR